MCLQKCSYTFVANSVPNPLGAFLRTSLRTCHLVHDHVCSAHIFVEEDFISSTHGFDMNLGQSKMPFNDTDAILADIDAAIKLVDERKADAYAVPLRARLAACRANFQAFVAVERILAVTTNNNILKADIDRAIAAIDNAVLCLEAVRTLPVGASSSTTVTSASSSSTSTAANSQMATTLPVSLRSLFDASYARRLLQVPNSLYSFIVFDSLFV